MMYPFMTLNDETEIVHSDMNADGTVKVYIETPDVKDGFHNLTCYLPSYKITENNGYTDEEVEKFMEIIKSTAHLIMEFSKEGGFENASGF
ncbi:MAG: hypothetical protein U0J42_02975 [[Bacteroides] pectinophilus]|nr:hypothetical protein [[Bacteroides] pectinophilus]